MAMDSFGQRRQENSESRYADSPESQRQPAESAGRGQASANQQTIAQTAHALLKRWEESRLKEEPQTELEMPIVPAQSGDSLVYAQGTSSHRSRYSEDAKTEPELDFSAAFSAERDTDLSSDTELLEELERYSPLRESQRAPLRATAPQKSASLKADETTLMPVQSAAREIRQTLEKTTYSSPATAPKPMPEAVAMSRQTSVQPDRQANRQTDRQTDRQTASQSEEDIFRHVPRTGFSESETLQTAALRQSLKDLALQKPVEKKASETAQTRPAGAPPFSASANSGLLRGDSKADSKEEKLRSERISAMGSISEEQSIRQTPSFDRESFGERLAKRDQTEAVSGKGLAQQAIESEISQKSSAGQVQFASTPQRLEEFETEQAIQPLKISKKSKAQPTGKQRNWSVLLGQFMTFVGAMAMTGGAAVVIGNRFGSLEIAETTGWLAMAGGHMLFVLGLYTHLTSRVEQTWNDLHVRSDEICRLIEQQQNAQQAYYQETSRISQPASSRGVK